MILTEAVTWESTTSRWLNSLGDFALQKLLPAALILVAGLCVLRALTLLVDRLLERSRLEKAALSHMRKLI